MIHDGVVEELGPQRCRLTLGSWSWPGLAAAIGRFDADIHVIGPPALRDAFAQLARRYAAAAADAGREDADAAADAGREKSGPAKRAAARDERAVGHAQGAVGQQGMVFRRASRRTSQ